MKTKEVVRIEATKMVPNGNILSQDIFFLLGEVFKVSPLVQLVDNGYYYTADSINELAKDIVNILEQK